MKIYKADNARPCQNCGGQNLVMRFICGDCQVLQNPQETIHQLNYFEVFNLDLAFQVDKSQVKNQYKKMQKLFHPDKIASQNNQEANKLAFEYSSQLNEAYSTLMSDLNRAIYILKINGHELDENSRLDDMEFMEEIFEKRMIIDQSEDPNEVLKMKETNDTRISDLLNQISNQFDISEFSDALKLIEKLKYYDRIDQAISEWEDRHSTSLG